LSRLALRHSWFLAAAICALHAAAAACVLLVVPGWPGAVVAPALVALGAHAAWRRALAPQSVVLEEKRPAGQCYVSRFLVVVPRAGGALLVTRDRLAAPEFRLLRLWALWGRLPRRSVAAAQLTT
jgi:hypothetical protein